MFLKMLTGTLGAIDSWGYLPKTIRRITPPQWLGTGSGENQSTESEMDEVVPKIIYDNLWAAVLNGNQTAVIAVAKTYPGALFIPSSEEVPGLFGRKFEKGTSPLEVLFWSFDPILLDDQGLLNTFAKKPFILNKLFEHRLAYFNKEGLMTSTLAGGWQREMFFSFESILKSLTGCIEAYDRSNLEQSKESLLLYIHALRDLPIWVAQYLCFEKKRATDNLALQIDNRKTPYLLSKNNVFLWSKLFENLNKEDLVFFGVYWQTTKSSSQCGLLLPHSKINESLYRSTLSSFENLKEVYNKLVIQFINANAKTFTEFSVSKAVKAVASYSLIQTLAIPLNTCKRKIKPREEEEPELQPVPVSEKEEKISSCTWEIADEAAQSELDGIEAALAQFFEKRNSLAPHISSLTAKGIFARVEVKITANSSLDDIIFRAKAGYNECRYVCMALEWMNGEGLLMPKAPEAVFEAFNDNLYKMTS